MASKALHPIVIDSVTCQKEPGFTCRGEGLLFEGVPCETSSALKDLLVPSKGREPIQNREKPKKWWQAMCKHYGLPSPKSADISTYRAHLENALRRPGGLARPQDLSELEFEENARFRKLNSDMRKMQEKVRKETEKPVPAPKGRKVVKDETKTTKKGSNKAEPTPAKGPAAGGSKPKSKKRPAPSSDAEMAPDPSCSTSIERGKQTARKSPSKKRAVNATRQVAATSGIVSGVYHIACPYITDRWHHDGFQLRFCTYASTPLAAHGDFDFGVVSGAFRATHGGLSASDYLRFAWCGKEPGGTTHQHTGTQDWKTGYIKFDRKNGTLSGVLNGWQGEFGFHGFQVMAGHPGNLTQWDSFDCK